MDSASADRANPSETIGEIWMELLELTELPADAYFLELGGNSLLANIFLGRLQEELGVELDMELVFNLSLRELAETISKG